MEAVNTYEGRYEHKDSIPCSSADSDASSSVLESNDSEQFSEDNMDQTDDDDDLKEDLQKTIPECYKSDSNFTSQTSSDITNDEEFQASALCQFMDILNDLDEVLDKSLLACLDDPASFDSDEDDLICKLKECIGEASQPSQSIAGSSEDDNTQVICAPSAPSLEDITDIVERHLPIGRSKSFSELSDTQRQTLVSTLERASTTNDGLRNSMRRLDPIMLPAISSQDEPLTLPVILFLEHHVNMRPTSAPIQLQVTAANLSSDGASGPLIVGRRALLMNRALSLPSPGESDVTGEWTGRNTARSTTRSSTSSSSGESLAGVIAVNQTAAGATEERNEETEEPPFGVWPHRMSAMLACLSCTVGIFNISRFAMFSVHFGASFIVQFFILSFLIGIPLFTLHLCLGQVLESGPVDMWRISPIFQGVGVSLLITQAVIGMYSIIGVSWIFVYFRDSFISTDDRYKWAVPQEFNFDDGSIRNGTFKIQETLPQYFNGEVLQRSLGANSSYFGSIKFQVAFNLAVVWMIVFVALSKGLRSYGKAVYMLIFLPICGTLVLCTKLLTLIPYDSVTNIFSETEWGEFFINSNSWAAATQETFLTWGLLGACIMQLTSHKNAKNKTNGMLQKESACIVAFTFAVLLLGSFLANTCVQILKNYGYNYIPGSYETVKSSQFLWPTSEPLPGNQVSTPVRYMGHYGSLVGVTVWRSGGPRALSGWQPLQLATQLVPATLAVLPANVLSPAWAVIFYFILIMFGVAQQLAVWHCVITGVMAINAQALRVWETTITFLSCVFGLAMGLLLSTDAGIRIVHFIDYVWVGSWWQCAIQVALVVGVFVVRGRPYSPDVVVAALYCARTRLSMTLAALTSFTWTVILPVLLCAICVVDFRVGQQRQLYTWRKPVGYWPIWARQVAVLMQQGAILTVPIAAFIQTWRYMSKGPPDILERIQNLYRPRMGASHESPAPRAAARSEPAPPAPDPPPKYTPPPSYSTATGARLRDTLRRSFRTLRRLTTGRTEPLQADDTSHTPITLSETVDRELHSLESQPPEYSGVFTAPSLTVTDETDSRPRISRPRSSTSRNSLSLTRDYLRRSFVRKSDSVKSIRSSLRRSFKYGGALTTSHEHLVRGAEPMSTTVAMSAMIDAEGSPHARSLASVI
ncbi:sodium-dependent transporter bedraggled isoform X2 [Pectinophora gossypiella]|nr:sodium-dependent transporter bedraggled isoform X2 [Pectinophora gossypiella]